MTSVARWLFSKQSTPASVPQNNVQIQENNDQLQENKKNLIDETQSETLADENARLRQELQKLTSQLRDKTKKLQHEGKSDDKNNDIYKLLEADLSTVLDQTETVDLTTFSTKYKTASSSTASTPPVSDVVEADSKKSCPCLLSVKGRGR